MSSTPAFLDNPVASPASPSPNAAQSSRTSADVPVRPNAPRTEPLPNHLEQRGASYADRLHGYITAHGGKYLRDEGGKLSIFLKGRNIPLDSEDIDLSSLLLQVCNVTTVLTESRIAVRRLQIKANETCSKIRERHFSACSDDEKRIFIPVRNEELLEISESTIRIVSNVTNDANLWIRHPQKTAFAYTQVNPQAGLKDFEQLLVETLSCKHNEMRWFVAMHEGLFPFVRDVAKARFLVTHEGSTQQGKTTGAQRFTLLHGLGDVIGDGSVAALSNQKDVGLLVLDNKEQKNLTQALIDFCLFLSTGARRLRSSNDGSETHTTNKFRPVGVITSIEGIHKAELAARNVPVQFCVSGGMIGREEIEREIVEKSNAINSALASVLQRFLAIRRQKRPTPNPFAGNFDAHFAALCDLLRAFGEVGGKPDEWAEGLIAAWVKTIAQREVESEDSEYEYSIREILYSANSLNVQRKDNVEIHGQKGTLFILQCGFLLAELRRLPGLLPSLPKSTQGFSNRLGTEKFQGLVFLREADSLEHLKRKNKVRFVGFFVPGDEVTTGDNPEKEIVTALSCPGS
jgi:hypothetical protein